MAFFRSVKLIKVPLIAILIHKCAEQALKKSQKRKTKACIFSKSKMRDASSEENLNEKSKRVSKITKVGLK